MFSGLLDELDKTVPPSRTLFYVLCSLDTERISLTALEIGAQAIAEQGRSALRGPLGEPAHRASSFTYLFRCPCKRTRISSVSAGPSGSTEAVSSILVHKEDRGTVVENLARLSLARLTSHCVLTIHDLTRDSVFAHISKGGDNDPINLAARLVSEALCSVRDPESPGSWPLCAELVPHLRHHVSNNSGACKSGSVKYQAAVVASQYLQASGHYHPSEDLLNWVLNCDAITRLDVDDPERLRIIDLLGLSSREIGNYNEARRLCQLALVGRENMLGRDHLDTLTSANNLATVYICQAKYDEAEVLHRRAVAGREKPLGHEHPTTLTSASNLAIVYSHQRKCDEAEVLQQRTFAACEKTLGRDHPDTLSSANNLAILYSSQGKYDEAATLYQHALAGREKALGRDHPNSLTSANNLATLYSRQGKYDEAEVLHLRAFAGREKALGGDHPDTLTSANNLATVYSHQGKHDEAEALHQRAFTGQQKALGDDHPDTLTSAYNLATVYIHQGKYNEAELFYHCALDGREKALGYNHPDTLASVYNLATVYIPKQI